MNVRYGHMLNPSLRNGLFEPPPALFSAGEIELLPADRAPRWVFYLALSIAFHLALLMLVPLSSITRQVGALFPIEVQLRLPAERPITDAVPELRSAHPRDSAERIVPATAPPAADRPVGSPPPDAGTAQIGDTGRGSVPATGVLLETARRIAREPEAAGDRGPGGKYKTGLTASERFARILRRPEAGERHFENGLTKIVTPDGTVFCYTEPPPFMQSGVVPPMAVSMTCP